MQGLAKARERSDYVAFRQTCLPRDARVAEMAARDGSDDEREV